MSEIEPGRDGGDHPGDVQPLGGEVRGVGRQQRDRHLDRRVLDAHANLRDDPADHQTDRRAA